MSVAALAPAAGGLAAVVWLYLLTAHGGWWRASVVDDAPLPEPANWPAVVAVVPARDEAAVIGRAVTSLAAQDYPGDFRIVVVDDGSIDGTAEVAKATSSPLPLAGGARDGVAGPGVGNGRADEAALLLPTPGPSRKREGTFSVLRAAPLASGWTGKLAAVAQGIAAAGDAPDWLWLTDADIAHAPDVLRRLVARAVAEDRVLVSHMARLATDTSAERALVPAFVWFFMLLYPFARVNGPGATAGAAGGVMLVNRAALARAGGIAAIRHALIDDCALAALMKRQGRIALFLTRRSVSLRPYPRVADIGAMIARSAYAQLGYSPWRLVATVVGLALIFLAPPLLAVFGHGTASMLGFGPWAMMAVAFVPMLRFYRTSPLWAPAVPAIAAVYGWYTLVSAAQYHRGRGGQWKGRAQAPAATA